MRNHDDPQPAVPGHGANKADLRAQLLAHRQAIPAEVRQRLDQAIAGHLLAWWNLHRFRSLGVYWPVRSEPDLRGAYAELARQGVRLALPTVADSTAPLVFIAWQPGAPTRRGAFGVQVPESGEAMAPEALLVPCVGFNPQNFRLGYGGGFYDRTLAASPRPATAGVAYACGLAQFAPQDFDVALDAIITENG